jgi:hypothetical protein
MGFQTICLKPYHQKNVQVDNNKQLFFGRNSARAGTLSTTFQPTKVSMQDPGSRNLNVDMSLVKSGIAKESVNVAASNYAMGYSFSVAGLLFPYHLGVADYLKEKQLIVQGTPLSGSSGGALAAALTALSFSGLDIENVLDTTQAAYTELRLSSLQSANVLVVKWMVPTQKFRQVCSRSPGPHAHNRA